jgi:hypothetical protein
LTATRHGPAWADTDTLGFEDALRRLVAWAFGPDSSLRKTGRCQWRLDTEDDRQFTLDTWDLLRSCDCLAPNDAVTPLVQRMVAEAYGRDVELEGHEDDATWTWHDRTGPGGSVEGLKIREVLGRVAGALELAPQT